MKGVLLFLAGIFLFAGCNNLDKITDPYPAQQTYPDAELKPFEFWISEGQVVNFDPYEVRIQCLSIDGGPNGSYKVLLAIVYPFSSVPDSWVEFSTSNLDYEYRLESDPGAEMTLLGVEKNGYEKKARLKMSPLFRL